MKRYLLSLVFLLLLWTIPAHATISFVGGAKASNAGFGATPATATYSPTAGNYVFMGMYGDANVTSTPSSVGGTITWTAVTTLLNDGSVYGRLWCGQAVSGVTAIVLTPGGSSDITIGVAEYSGVGSCTNDGLATRVTTTGAISITPTNGDLVLYVNPQNGFSFTTTFGTARSAAQTVNTMYWNDVTSSSGTQAPNSGAGDTSYICILVAFKPPGAGGAVRRRGSVISK